MRSSCRVRSAFRSRTTVLTMRRRARTSGLKMRPAVNTPSTPPNPGAPVAGANSFTEGQAKSRIESNGFANVSELRKDDQGVWRGKAMKDGKSVSVSVDFQGNVTAQ